MCLDDIDIEKSLVSLPMEKKSTCTCKASLHKICLNEWYKFKKEKVCPICLAAIQQNKCACQLHVIESAYQRVCNSWVFQVISICVAIVVVCFEIKDLIKSYT
jgi:hypothetical protein